ncbi:sensor histidine kinase [Parachitinimonas caeni]|uniref:histidine kinase n=1 Tax=Parachitinimonas caeni TaxID=3031301 RepID=A0ABT7DRT2_9NEIS|nr:hypothetical protein [Parachitinimonas caeni]MDK2122782.1 hypothetical protein [Parachitinimonas caeni]
MNNTLKEILGGMSEGLVLVGFDGRVRYSNAAAERMTGLERPQPLPPGPLREAISRIAQSPNADAAEFVLRESSASVVKARCLPGMQMGEAVVLLTESRKEGLYRQALDNLMTVIGLDLREPCNQLAGSLNALIEDQPELAEQLEAVNKVSELLGKLADLGQLWGSDGFDSEDRIVLHEMLAEIWTELSPQAKQHGVRVSINGLNADSAPVYGSRVWLKRALEECLREAIASSAKGSNVEIEGRQIGQRIMLVFRNLGFYAPPEAGSRSFLPVPTVSAERRAEAVIGLNLCKRIVELHGGALREECEFDQLDFVVELPTGAPVRSNNSELDLAQAKRYAADMSRLLARRNKAKDAPAAG